MSETASQAIWKISGFPLSRPRLLPVLAFIAVLLVISLFFVWSRIQVINLEYEISSLESRQRALLQETKRLRVEAATLRSPQRIERLAKNKLGLRYPSPEQVIIVEP